MTFISHTLKCKLFAFGSILLAIFFFASPTHLLASPALFSHVAISKDSLKIKVHYKEAKSRDTLDLNMINILYESSSHDIEYKAVCQKDGWFIFEIPVKQPSGYWGIYKSRTFTKRGAESNNFQLTANFFWEKGDDLTLELSNRETYAGIYSKYTFSGKGSEKYNLRKNMDSVKKVSEKISAQLGNHPPLFDKDFTYNNIDFKQSKLALELLESKKQLLTPLSYEALKVEFSFEYLRNVGEYYTHVVKTQNDSIRKKFIAQYIAQFSKPNTFGISDDVLAQIPKYLRFVYWKYWSDSHILKGGFDPKWIYEQLRSNYAGVLRDRLIVYFLLSAPNLSTDSNTFYSDAEQLLKAPDCLQVIRELNGNAVGKKFSNFNLPDITGKRFTLADFKGKTIVIDCWFNGCGYCAVLYKNALSKVEQTLKQDKDVAFVSISGDISKSLWNNGIKSGLYTSAIATNLYTDGQGFKHPFLINNNFTGFPVILILDKTGRIKKLNSKDLYEYEGLLKAIKD